MSDYIVALTGGIGSGKSTVAQGFVEHGAALVDTDLLAHRLTSPGGAAMPALQAAFSSGIVGADGALDRTVMRHLAFTDQHARARLEAILHPLIRASALAECQQANAPYVILAVPLLVETGNWQNLCDRVLVVDCSTASQIARVIQRSGLSPEEVHKILAAQASREQRLAIADDVIGNDATPEDLMPHVLRLHQQYLALAAAKKLHANC